MNITQKKVNGNKGKKRSEETKALMKASALLAHQEGRHGGFKKGHKAYTQSGKDHHAYQERVPFLCPECEKTKMVTPRQAETIKYCCKKCFNSAGLSEEQRKKIGDALRGPKHTSWKGEKVGYCGLHRWVNRMKGIPTICFFCDTPKTDKRYGYANLDHKYKRNVNDYVSACGTCHKRYDMLFNPSKKLTT